MTGTRAPHRRSSAKAAPPGRPPSALSRHILPRNTHQRKFFHKSSVKRRQVRFRFRIRFQSWDSSVPKTLQSMGERTAAAHLLVGEHVPDAIAGQQQELVTLLQRQPPHLRAPKAPGRHRAPGATFVRSLEALRETSSLTVSFERPLPPMRDTKPERNQPHTQCRFAAPAVGRPPPLQAGHRTCVALRIEGLERINARMSRLGHRQGTALGAVASDTCWPAWQLTWGLSADDGGRRARVISPCVIAPLHQLKEVPIRMTITESRANM